MRIRPSSGFLLSLLAMVSCGKLLPAAMQRPYVWRKEDVEALCDSIVSGFPVGGFLLWAPGDKADLNALAKARLGPLHKAEPGTTPAYQPYYLLLDGQNRLATLAWAMQETFDIDLPDASEPERETWLGGERLVLDFATRSVKFVPTAEANVGLRLPAWTLMATASDELHSKASRLLRIKADTWIESFGEEQTEEFISFWDRACNGFREARTTETVIEDATPAEARHAFLRICRVGVPMSAEDFDNAVGWVAPVLGHAGPFSGESTATEWAYDHSPEL